jgi:Tfp pilus assembly protein PilF
MLAEVAMRVDRTEDAERLLERCLELAPGFDRRTAQLRDRAEPREQAAGSDRRTRTAPCARIRAIPAYRNLKAVALCHTGDYETAIGIYDELTRAYPAQAPIWLSLGHASKTAGQTSRAIEAYRKCIELDADFGEAYWSLANLKTFRFDDAHLEAMRNALARADLRPEHRVCIEFALGKALEDRAAYAESFEHYATGNTLRLEQIPYSAADTSARLARAKATYSADFFRERAGSASPQPDPIFIVGMPRAGSTLVEQILASHSAVEGTDGTARDHVDHAQPAPAAADKHPGAYHDALARMNGGELRALGEQYIERTRIHRKLGRPFFIDKMPNNFAHVGLIQLVLPNAKIIDVRRNPLACGFSCFKQHFAHGQNFTYGLENVGRYYRDYAELMAHFDAVLPGRIIE